MGSGEGEGEGEGVSEAEADVVLSEGSTCASVFGFASLKNPKTTPAISASRQTTIEAPSHQRDSCRFNSADEPASPATFSAGFSTGVLEEAAAVAATAGGAAFAPVSS